MPELVKQGYRLARKVIVGREATCYQCAATVRFLVEDADRARETDDQRDGNYWSIPWVCPDRECGAQNTTSIRVPRQEG